MKSCKTHSPKIQKSIFGGSRLTISKTGQLNKNSSSSSTCFFVSLGLITYTLQDAGDITQPLSSCQPASFSFLFKHYAGYTEQQFISSQQQNGFRALYNIL